MAPRRSTSRPPMCAGVSGQTHGAPGVAPSRFADRLTATTTATTGAPATSGAPATTAPAAAAGGKVPAGWTTYTDEKTGYQVAHPEGWRAQSRGGNRTDFTDLSQTGLAALYRELAYNAPGSSDKLGGGATDRNTELVLKKG